MEKEKNYLLLKWGSLKDLSGVNSPKAKKLIKQWFKLGSNSSAIMHRDTPEQKKIICKIIDECDEIQNDWTGEMMTKEEAKDYVMDYGKDR